MYQFQLFSGCISIKSNVKFGFNETMMISSIIELFLSDIIDQSQGWSGYDSIIFGGKYQFQDLSGCTSMNSNVKSFLLEISHQFQGFSGCNEITQFHGLSGYNSINQVPRFGLEDTPYKYVLSNQEVSG